MFMRLVASVLLQLPGRCLIFNSHPFVLVGRGKLDTSGVIIGLPDLALVTTVAVCGLWMDQNVKIKGKQSIIAVNRCLIQVLKSRNNDSFFSC